MNPENSRVKRALILNKLIIEEYGNVKELVDVLRCPEFEVNNQKEPQDYSDGERLERA